MNSKLTIALAVLAGFFGGLAAHYVIPPTVHAQASQTAPPQPEIRAQKFVLVEADGTPRGVFGIEANGAPVVEITNKKGHVFVPRWNSTRFWEGSAPPYPQRKPTLLP